ncbi:MAG: GNAT family N-acetyltransferase [Bacteroidota bacterium]|nr:GNAT family N-acetyltransferase [Bacteroidota bacterium]
MDDNFITYKKLSQADITKLTELINIYADVFDTENFSIPNKEYLQTLLDKENIVFCVALLDNLVIGGLTAYILPSVYYPSSQVYIYDLAIKQNMQRQGIGKKLILFLKNYCTEFGHKEIYVQADIEDQNAIDFYKATGGHSEKVIHFTYDLTSVK